MSKIAKSQMNQRPTYETLVRDTILNPKDRIQLPNREASLLKSTQQLSVWDSDDFINLEEEQKRIVTKQIEYITFRDMTGGGGGTHVVEQATRPPPPPPEAPQPPQPPPQPQMPKTAMPGRSVSSQTKQNFNTHLKPSNEFGTQTTDKFDMDIDDKLDRMKEHYEQQLRNHENAAQARIHSIQRQVHSQIADPTYLDKLASLRVHHNQPPMANPFVTSSSSDDRGPPPGGAGAIMIGRVGRSSPKVNLEQQPKPHRSRSRATKDEPDAEMIEANTRRPPPPPPPPPPAIKRVIAADAAEKRMRARASSLYALPPTTHDTTNPIGQKPQVRPRSVSKTPRSRSRAREESVKPKLEPLPPQAKPSSAPAKIRPSSAPAPPMPSKRLRPTSKPALPSAAPAKPTRIEAKPSIRVGPSRMETKPSTAPVKPTFKPVGPSKTPPKPSTATGIKRLQPKQSETQPRAKARASSVVKPSTAIESVPVTVSEEKAKPKSKRGGKKRTAPLEPPPKSQVQSQKTTHSGTKLPPPTHANLKIVKAVIRKAIKYGKLAKKEEAEVNELTEQSKSGTREVKSNATRRLKRIYARIYQTALA